MYRQLELEGPMSPTYSQNAVFFIKHVLHSLSFDPHNHTESQWKNWDQRPGLSFLARAFLFVFLFMFCYQEAANSKNILQGTKKEKKLDQQQKRLRIIEFQSASTD